MLTKLPYSEHPPRFDYRLTDRGRDLWPVVTAMRQRGRQARRVRRPATTPVHKDCGQISEPQLVCSACGELLGPRDVKAIPGPGEVEHLVPVG